MPEAPHWKKKSAASGTKILFGVEMRMGARREERRTSTVGNPANGAKSLSGWSVGVGD